MELTYSQWNHLLATVRLKTINGSGSVVQGELPPEVAGVGSEAIAAGVPTVLVTHHAKWLHQIVIRHPSQQPYLPGGLWLLASRLAENCLKLVGVCIALIRKAWQ